MLGLILAVVVAALAVCIAGTVIVLRRFLRRLAREGREGWLRLGQPPFRTVPELPAERFVRPRPGRLVLFPSYMWHGTVPFGTEERRMTIAFDLIPGISSSRA